MSKESQKLLYRYHFFFEGGEPLVFGIELDPATMQVVDQAGSELSPWTELGNNQCSHCPLKVESCSRCPVANQISRVVERFKNHQSIESVRVMVETPERRYEKDVSLQQGLSSLLGILMAGSACPHTDFLKPLLRFHLPFATNQETFTRALSMSLLAHYLRGQKSFDTENAIEDLSAKYKNMREINRAMRERIKSVEAEDANANALMILDCFALDASFRIDQALFKDLKKVFDAGFAAG